MKSKSTSADWVVLVVYSIFLPIMLFLPFWNYYAFLAHAKSSPRADAVHESRIAAIKSGNALKQKYGYTK